MSLDVLTTPRALCQRCRRCAACIQAGSFDMHPAARDADRDGLLSVKNTHLLNEVVEVEVGSAFLDSELVAYVDARHPIRGELEALLFPSRKRWDSALQGFAQIDEVSHEKVMERRREQHQVAKLVTNGAAAQFVHGGACRIECAENASMVRIPERDGHAAADAESCGVPEEGSALRIGAVVVRIPDKGHISVVRFGDPGIDLEIAHFRVSPNPQRRKI